MESYHYRYLIGSRDAPDIVISLLLRQIAFTEFHLASPQGGFALRNVEAPVSVLINNRKSIRELKGYNKTRRRDACKVRHD